MKQEGGPMQIFKASEFKAKCLKLMTDIQQRGEEIIITTPGPPLRPLVNNRLKEPTLLGMHKSKVSSGDSEIFTTGVTWETDQ